MWLLSSSDRTGDVLGTATGTPETYGTTTTPWSFPTKDTSVGYVAVRFDNAGNMLGTSDYISSTTSPVNNSAIHRTCWSSFSGANFSSLS